MARLVIITLAALFMVLRFANAASGQNLATNPDGRIDVYLLRGGFAGVFSRGLDQIGKDLNTRGVRAKVLSHGSWKRVTNAIINDRKKYGRHPVVLIGHSQGANNSLKIAEQLKRERIRVDFMVTFAATNTIGVPSNVRKVTNYFFKTNGWGVPLRPGPGFRGRLENIDFSKNKSVGHFNIDKQPGLQRQVIRNILRYVAPNVRSRLTHQTEQSVTIFSPKG